MLEVCRKTVRVAVFQSFWNSSQNSRQDQLDSKTYTSQTTFKWQISSQNEKAQVVVINYGHLQTSMGLMHAQEKAEEKQ